MRTMMSPSETREDSRGSQLIDNPAQFIQDIGDRPVTIKESTEREIDKYIK